MGKNKKAPKRVHKKDPVATKVAGHKKHHTKPVVPNLKKLKHQNKALLSNLDASVTKANDLTMKKSEGLTKSSAKASAAKAPKASVTKSKARMTEADVDMACEVLDSLATTSAETSHK